MKLNKISAHVLEKLTPKKEVMTTPTAQFLQSNLPSIKKELVIEIELNGKMKFENLLDCIHIQMGINYKVLCANVEYKNGANFGSFQLYLKVTAEEYSQLEFFLNKNKLLNTTVEYTCRKYF